MKSAPLWLLVALGSACAGRSEAEIEAEFDAFVAQNNRCASSSDCAIAGAGCPLGCWVAVNETQVDAVKAKARELIDEYEAGGRSCQYGCVEPTTPTCDQGRCQADPFLGNIDGGIPAPIE